jgi:gamma-glutamyltranspeptidase/glutathione hydrolase
MRLFAMLALAAVAAARPAGAAAPPAIEAAGGMVVSAQRLASDAGVAMLARGGNAIDAAVAVS